MKWLQENERSIVFRKDYDAGPETGPAFVYEEPVAGRFAIGRWPERIPESEMKRNLVGLVGVILLAMAFIMPWLHRPVAYLVVQISALGCGIIAVHRSRKWLL